MIYITQGHELSIGPEVFLKAFVHLPKSSHKEFIYVGTKECLKTQLEFLKIPYSIDADKLFYLNSTLKCHFIKKIKYPLSTEALLAALKLINKKDILLTLPTSKDQIFLGSQPCAGHTDFFRKYFKTKDISMVFSSPSDKLLLITDHIPLKEVPKSISEKTIIDKISISLKNYAKYFSSFEEVLVSGINPHVGEGGILGTEEKNVKSAISKLKPLFKKIDFKGPFSGDSLHFHQNLSKKQLQVYMYHDQGLAPFKGKNGLIGLNISLGLPFLRMSVDHGTAFLLYGQNRANYLGCYYLLIKALKVNNGTRSNQNHESKST